MRIFCVGRNYKLHIQELGNETPEKPVIFMKPDTAVMKENGYFYIPSFSSEIHYESELIIKISKHGKNINPKFSHRYYNYLSLGIDFTARDLQHELKTKGLPWLLSKGFDNSAVIGNWIEKDKFSDINQISFNLSVNGEVKQKGNSSMMIYGIDFLISFISKYITLKKGDILFTGTPSGVGQVHQGDILIGTVENTPVFNIRIK